MFKNAQWFILIYFICLFPLIHHIHDLVVLVTYLCMVILFHFLMHSKYQKVFYWIIPFLLLMYVEYTNQSMFYGIDSFGNILINYLLIAWLQTILMMGMGRFAPLCNSVLFILFGYINQLLRIYKGSPLLPFDLASLTTAANVAKQFHLRIDMTFFSGIGLFLLILIYTFTLPKKIKKIRWIPIHLICFVLLGIFYQTDWISKPLGIAPDFFDQNRGYKDKGAVAEFIANTKYMQIKKPTVSLPTKTPDVNPIDKVIHPEAKPNIVIIMDEAFSDLRVLDKLPTTQEVLPYFSSLQTQPNTIYGNLYVSTLGTGTSNTEFEVLTGNSMAFFPYGSNAYQLFVRNHQPSLPSLLKQQGYQTIAFHPYYASSWNRPNAYQAMGFDQFISLENLQQPDKLRGYVSDAYDFDYVFDLLKQAKQPTMIMNVTMQNHSPYNFDYPSSIHLDSQTPQPEVEQYLTMTNITDQQLATFIAKCQTLTTPTIVLFYGDHQPFLPTSYTDTLSKDNLQQHYITQYMLWANYPITKTKQIDLSANYLGALLLEKTGLASSPYFQYLSSLFHQYPIITTMQIHDTNQNPVSKDIPALQEYYAYIYENVFRKKNLDPFILGENQ